MWVDRVSAGAFTSDLQWSRLVAACALCTSSARIDDRHESSLRLENHSAASWHVLNDILDESPTS